MRQLIVTSIIFLYLTTFQSHNAQDRDQEELPMPPNGTITCLTENETTAPLRIVASNSGNYYIRIENIVTKKTIQTIFVRSGETIEVEVPLGSYIIKYAVGEKWYGENYLFGSSTSYYKADEIFNFHLEGEQVLGYLIRLRKQISGNLREQAIPPDEFQR